MKKSKPVWSYEEYVESVKEVDPLVSEDLIKASAGYLQDMGEVGVFYCTSMIILNQIFFLGGDKLLIHSV